MSDRAVCTGRDAAVRMASKQEALVSTTASSLKDMTHLIEHTPTTATEKQNTAVLQGGPKITAPYILLFIVLLYLFTFTNYIPRELKLCPRHIEAQTKLVRQQVVQKITTESKHLNIIISQWQNTTAMHGYAYIQVTAAYNKQTVK